METYLTIEEVAGYLKLAPQTIRKYVLNRAIPFRKVQKSIRFRVSEIEQWIDEGGGNRPSCADEPREGDLFDDLGAGGDGRADENGDTCKPFAAGCGE
jgi:excisionase family DNA binding protein